MRVNDVLQIKKGEYHMDALEYRIKSALNSVIRKTFPKEQIEPLDIEFMNQETVSIHGTYQVKTKKARIGNLSRPPAHVLITSLHEAAHHCEYQMTGQTGHQRSFYMIYNQLMTTAIEIGLFTYEMAEKVTDSASIRQLKRYCGPITIKANPDKKYKKGKCLIYVFDGYSQRKLLSDRGYHFNSRAKAWEKEILKENEKEEVKYIKSLSENITIWTTDDMLDLTIYAIITVTGRTYECKDILSSLNFIYRDKVPGGDVKGWFKKVQSVQLPEYTNAIRILSNYPGVKVEVKY